MSQTDAACPKRGRQHERSERVSGYAKTTAEWAEDPSSSLRPEGITSADRPWSADIISREPCKGSAPPPLLGPLARCARGLAQLLPRHASRS